jgi:GT2 family glycosyltransferase
MIRGSLGGPLAGSDAKLRGSVTATPLGGVLSALGVVVVHFGDPGPTQACLGSLLADPSPVDRSIAAVDNSANLLLADAPPSVLHLRFPDNPGFGAGANRGAAALAARNAVAGFVFLNGDVEVLPGFLGAAAAALAGGAGAVGGPLFLDRQGGPLWYAGGRVDLLTGTVRQSRRARDARRAREVAFVPGAALAVSAPAFHAVGGFGPAFFLYNEDLDLCLRLSRAGFRLRFEPRMAAVHHLGAATGSADRSPLYLEEITRTRLLPFPSRAHRLWLAVLHTGWVSLRAGLLLLRRGPCGLPHARALLRGHRAALASAWSRELPPRPRPAS